MTAGACGDCTLCCKVMAIEELSKKASQWCRHCKPGRGCQIHDSRPGECRDFNCLWLIDQRFGPHWRPNKSKLVLTTSEDGIEVRCDASFPDAWRRDPFTARFEHWRPSARRMTSRCLSLSGSG